MSLGYVLEGLLDAVDRVETAEGAVDHQHEPAPAVLGEVDQPVDHPQTRAHQLWRELELRAALFFGVHLPRLFPLLLPLRGEQLELRELSVWMRLFGLFLFIARRAVCSDREDHVFGSQQRLYSGFFVVDLSGFLG